MKLWLKVPDIVIILIAAGTVFFSASVYMKPQERSFVLIRGQYMEWTFPVNAAETVAVPGQLGDTIVRIHDSRAWVESSPCQNQTCVAAGSVARQGQWAACLPNGVLLMIYGAEETGVDAIVR